MTKTLSLESCDTGEILESVKIVCKSVTSQPDCNLFCCSTSKKCVL